MKVKDVMRSRVVTLGAEDHLSVADEVMSMGRIRHLPVLDSHRRVVGIVTQKIYDFHEGLSLPVANAVPLAVSIVLDLLREPVKV